MSNRSSIKFGARFLVLSLILGAFWLFNTGSTLAAKNRGAATANAQTGNSQLTGQLIVGGPVTVNEKTAITGTTIFTDSRIAVECAKRNSAVVDLGKLGRIELTAGSKMTLRFDQGLISGDLTEGKAVIRAPAGMRVAVNTPQGVVSANCGQACVTPVVVQGVQCVPVVAGQVGGVAGPGGPGIAAIAGIGGGVAAATAFAARGDDEADFVTPIIP
jgi:hypothetical protein